MGSIIRIVFLGILFCFGALICLMIVSGIENEPIVDRNKALSYKNIKKAKQIIKDNRPRQFYNPTVKKLSLTENEINLLISYAISQGFDTEFFFSRVALFDGYFHLFLTKKLKFNLFGQYLNIRTSFRPKGIFIRLDACRIGRLNIPNLMTWPIISGLHYLMLKINVYESLWNTIEGIKKITIRQTAITCHYTIDSAVLKDLQTKGRAFLIPDLHQQKLLAYHNHLAKLTHSTPHKTNSVLALIQGIFAFAQKNSITSKNPILENKVALQVLSLYAIGHKLNRILKPEYSTFITAPNPTRLVFHNRSDLPKHFFVSAAITVSTGEKFAKLVGLAKEIDDSDGGSGFSFADLAADKAGVKFGEAATASSQKAIQFQEKILQVRTEKELFPSISNLPEGIMELEFKNTYKNLDSEAYKLINAEIDKRLNLCRLYRE